MRFGLLGTLQVSIDDGHTAPLGGYRQRLVLALLLLHAGQPVLEDRLAADLALGRAAAVAGELRTLLIDHPLRQRLRALLMLALYREGQTAEALSVHEDGRTPASCGKLMWRPRSCRCRQPPRRGPVARS